MILKILNKLFKKQMERFKQKSIQEYEEKNHQIFYQVNFPLGTKIIYQENGPYPLIIGEVVDYEFDQDSNQFLCKIEKTNKETKIISGALLEWNEHREKYLRKLHWWERWSIFNSDTISTEEGNRLTEELRKLEQIS